MADTSSASSLPPPPPRPATAPPLAGPVAQRSSRHLFHHAARFVGILAVIWLTRLLLFGDVWDTSTADDPSPAPVPAPAESAIRNNLSTVEQADALGCRVLLALQDEMQSTGEFEINTPVWDELNARIDDRDC